jgi:uncharacterized membrane protein/glutaredoxin
MLTVTLYRKADCEDCQKAIDDLQSLQESIPHQLIYVDLDQQPSLVSAVGANVPVVEVGPYRLKPPFSKQDLQMTLGAARDRATHYTAVGDTQYQERVERGRTVTGADRFTAWFSDHYMRVFNLIFLFYTGLPFLPPVLMKIGATFPADIIYRVYRLLCHQLAFRSWFLFGEQAAYPRALANVAGLRTFEQVTGINSLDITASANFIGNPQLGYKVAFCERDVAIYGAILLFGVLFAVTGMRLKSLPWYLWILIGIVPIAIDGFSQLPSLTTLSWLSSLPMRESTPLLRTITGFLFGFTTAWFGFPYIEESMRETRLLMARKLAIADQAISGAHAGKVG